MVYASDKPHMVEIVKTVLQKHDIESVILDKRDSTYIGIGDMELYVNEKEMVLARFLIDEWKKNGS